MYCILWDFSPNVISMNVNSWMWAPFLILTIYPSFSCEFLLICNFKPRAHPTLTSLCVASRVINISKCWRECNFGFRADNARWAGAWEACYKSIRHHDFLPHFQQVFTFLILLPLDCLLAQMTLWVWQSLSLCLNSAGNMHIKAD